MMIIVMRKNTFTLIALGLTFVAWRYLGPAKPAEAIVEAMPEENMPVDAADRPAAGSARAPSAADAKPEARESLSVRLGHLESDLEKRAELLYRENDALRGVDYRVGRIENHSGKSTLNVDLRAADSRVASAGDLRMILRYARSEMLAGFEASLQRHALEGLVEVTFTVDGRELARSYWDAPDASQADADEVHVPEHIRSR